MSDAQKVTSPGQWTKRDYCTACLEPSREGYPHFLHRTAAPKRRVTNLPWSTRVRHESYPQNTPYSVKEMPYPKIWLTPSEGNNILCPLLGEALSLG